MLVYLIVWKVLLGEYGEGNGGEKERKKMLGLDVWEGENLGIGNWELGKITVQLEYI